MALRLLTESQNIRGNEGNRNAKSAITPHWRSQVMVKQIAKRNSQNLGRTYEAIHE
jgi:hypothetical protein